MKYKWIILVIMVLIAVPAIHAIDTSNWGEITVNKVTFKVPQEYFNESDTDEKSTYSYGEPFKFMIKSLMTYDKLKHEYGLWSTDRGAEIEQDDIGDHPCVIITDYNKYYDRYDIHVFFATGKKIFYIWYQKGEVNDELMEIIKSTPKSKMSEDKFMDKLDDAQKGYIDEDTQKNLELDLEDYYRDYEKRHDDHRFYSIGSNGWTFGHVYDY